MQIDTAAEHEGCPIVVSVKTEKQHQARVEDGVVLADSNPISEVMLGHYVSEVSTLKIQCLLHEVEIEGTHFDWQ